MRNPIFRFQIRTKLFEETGVVDPRTNKRKRSRDVTEATEKVRAIMQSKRVFNNNDESKLTNVWGDEVERTVETFIKEGKKLLIKNLEQESMDEELVIEESEEPPVNEPDDSDDEDEAELGCFNPFL